MRSHRLLKLCFGLDIAILHLERLLKGVAHVVTHAGAGSVILSRVLRGSATGHGRVQSLVPVASFWAAVSICMTLRHMNVAEGWCALTMVLILGFLPFDVRSLWTLETRTAPLGLW